MKKVQALSVSFYKVWLMTSGIYMTAGRCPCCGGPVCPVGMGTALLIGGGIAGLAHAAGVWKKDVSPVRSGQVGAEKVCA